jgi:hypothetical protein
MTPMLYKPNFNLDPAMLAAVQKALAERKEADAQKKLKEEQQKAGDKKPEEKGISTTTLVIGGAVALVALILFMRR